MMNAGLGALAPNPTNPMVGQPQQMAYQQPPVASQGLGAANPNPMVYQQPPVASRGLGAVNPNPMASQPQPFQQLLALNEAVKTMNLQRAAQGQQAMAQAQQMPPTIKDQLEMALQQAQAQQPVPGMARGGVVAFKNGGLSMAGLEGLDEDIMTDEFAGFSVTPEQMAADDLRVQEAPIRKRIQRLEAQIKELEAKSPSNIQLGPLRQELAGLKGSLTSMPPAPAGIGAPPAAAPAGLAAALPPPAAAAPPPAALPPPAATAATPSARPRAGSGGAGGAGGVGLGAAAPQYDELTQLRRMSEQLAKDVEGTAVVDPRVLEARQAYDAMLKASMDPAEQQMRELEAQQRRGLLDNPEAIAAMLEGLAGAQTFGEGLARAGAGAAKARASGQKELRESQANLVRLRQELAKAEAEARLARAEKDVEGEQRAKLKATEIRAAMNKEIYELRTRRISADASATSAANRGEATAGRSDFQKDSLVRRAIADVQSKNPIPSGIKDPARQRLIDQQIDAVATQVAPLGITREQVVGYFSTSGQASAAPGATLSAQDRALIERYTAPK